MRNPWKVATLVLATIIAAAAVYYNPWIPFADRGHRAFGVCDNRGLFAAVTVIEATTSERLDYVFDYGTTRQALFKDHYTVINRLQGSQCREHLQPSTGDAPSFAVHNPEEAAQKAVQMFRELGYEADAQKFANQLWLVRTTALNASDIVYRRHALMMGGAPKKVGMFSK